MKTSSEILVEQTSPSFRQVVKTSSLPVSSI
jgi:hypothetical protein